MTGAELEIAGPDFERESTEWCTPCGGEQEGWLSGYRGELWFDCGTCGESTQLEPALYPARPTFAQLLDYAVRLIKRRGWGRT